MPISNYRDPTKVLAGSAARLIPIYKQLQKEIFGEEDNTFQFFGAAVRESLVGGTFDELDVEINLPEKAFHKKAILYYLKQFGVEGESNNRFAGTLKVKTQFGVEYKINIWFIRPVSVWSCDVVSFYLENGRPRHYNASFVPSISNYQNSIFIEHFNEVTADNVVDYLKTGADLVARYGWQMQQKTLDKLNSIIESAKPLEMFYETIMGFRSYKIGPGGYLYGFHNAKWETAELEVDCDMFRQHIKVSESTVDGNVETSDKSSGHGCGIYIYKDLMECILNYQGDAIALVVANGGDFWEGERGFRVEKARIEKLWVFRGSNPLRTHYEVNGGVVVDCTRTEAIREILNSGLKIDSERALL